MEKSELCRNSSVYCAEYAYASAIYDDIVIEPSCLVSMWAGLSVTNKIPIS